MFRPIAITAVLNGWIVTVGCQTLVFGDRVQLLHELDAYLKDPGATEQRFIDQSVNTAHTLGGIAAAPAPPMAGQMASGGVDSGVYSRRLERERAAGGLDSNRRDPQWATDSVPTGSLPQHG